MDTSPTGFHAAFTCKQKEQSDHWVQIESTTRHLPWNTKQDVQVCYAKYCYLFIYLTQTTQTDLQTNMDRPN